MCLTRPRSFCFVPGAEALGRLTDLLEALAHVSGEQSAIVGRKAGSGRLLFRKIVKGYRSGRHWSRTPLAAHLNRRYGSAFQKRRAGRIAYFGRRLVVADLSCVPRQLVKQCTSSKPLI
jgi:hypothetical protein